MIEELKNEPIMNVQHALLAAESDVKNTALLMKRETEHLFDKSTNFDEIIRTYAAFEENDRDLPENEKKKMTTTVNEKLKYIKPFIIKEFDLLASKENTNTIAKDDIIIHDDEGNVLEILGKDIPVSALLQLETKLTDLRNVYKKIPTFNPEIDWIKGVNLEGEECWIEKEPRIKVRTVTNKEWKPIDVNPVSANDKFKCELKEVSINKPVGEFKTVYKTGSLSPKNKANMLERIDQVIAAVKAARARANVTKVKELPIGNSILTYINGF